MNMTMATTDIRPYGMQSFFKPDEHFDYLRTVVLPNKSCKPLRVWFAGCSTGESAYSLGMLIDDYLSGSREWEIVATDSDAEKLDIAKLGQYDWSEMASVPPPYRETYFRLGTRGCSKNTFIVKQQLRQRIFFVRMSINRMLPPFEPFDVIIVRESLKASSAMCSVEHLVPLLAAGGYMLLENVRTPSAPVLMELDDGFLVRTYESPADDLPPPFEAREVFPCSPSQRVRLYGVCSEM